MEPIKSFEDLKHVQRNPNQYWLYVLLAPVNDPTQATFKIIENLDVFDLDTGNHCDYYLPGFVCDEHGIVSDYIPNSQFSNLKYVYLDRLGGCVPFDGKLFVKFYRELEKQCDGKWRYSGQCELLLLNIDPITKHVQFSDFYSYNLDDIVNNGKTITQFIRQMIIISQESYVKKDAKRRIDETYYELVIPKTKNNNLNYYNSCERAFQESGFIGKKYCFISYSTKDKEFVNQVYELLKAHDINCWKAPNDIPRGTSYAYIIENAINNASMFILMLSKNSINSIWVEKELLRAIDIFQRNDPDRICVVWCDKEFSLHGTSFAVPLENIQIKVKLENDLNNWELLLDQIN